VPVRGEGGIPDDQWECDTVLSRGRDQVNLHEGIAPVGSAKLPTFPPLHMGWSDRFRVLSPKACGTLLVLQGDNSSNRSYPHTAPVVVLILTPRLSLPSGTTRRCPKAVSQRIPCSKMHPHQRHSRSSASLTDDGVIVTCNM
jgi:hypothetical protein